jgi:hypothetical protein
MSSLLVQGFRPPLIEPMCLGRTDGEENALAYLNFLRTGRSFLVHVETSNCAVFSAFRF